MPVLLYKKRIPAIGENPMIGSFLFDNIDDALIEGLDQNQDFFSLLLGNDEIKREVLGIFTEEIYNSLRKA